MKKLKYAGSVSILAMAIMSTPLYAEEANNVDANNVDVQQTEETIKDDQADSDNDQRSSFGDIVVTANKREQNLNDVGISVSAFSSEQLDQLGITEATQITQQIPGLQLNAWSPNVTIFNLRGVSQNNFSDNLEAPVAVYTDGAYIGSINGLSGQLFDTKRVEVLRGPQGTLFGRNATGGLIHYISQDASEDKFNGYLEAGYGNFNAFQVEAAVGGAIAEGIRFRASGRYSRKDGYVISSNAIDGITNEEAGLPDPSGQDLGGEDGLGARLTFQFDLGPNAVLNLWGKFSQDFNVDTGGYVFDNCNVTANGFCQVDAAGLGNGNEGVTNGITGEAASPFENFSETPGNLNRNSQSLQADLTWNLGGIELTSITNYLTLEKEYEEDGDALPVQILNFQTNQDYSQFSQEIRFAGETGRFNWQAGGYYLDIDLDGDANTVGAPIIGVALDLNGDFNDPAVLQEYFINSSNWSIFGQFDYAVSDTVTLTVGGRYSEDDKSIDYLSTLNDIGFESVTVGSDEIFSEVVPDVDIINFNNWAARVALEWQPNNDTLLFASWNRGIKGGNWTLADNIEPSDFQHDEEILNSFEAGFKIATLGGDLRLNGTFYHYIYDDYQAFALTGGTPQVTNTDANATGAEIELFYSPSRSFDVVLGATWQTSNVDFVDGPGEQIAPELFPGAPDDENCTNIGGAFSCIFQNAGVANAQLPNAPNFSANYLFRYNRDFAGGNIAFQFDGAWFDDQFLEVTNGLSSQQNAYNVSNLSLNWTNSSETLTLSAWARNIFDQEYRVYSLNLGVLGTTSFFAPPLTFGGTLGFKF